MFALFACNNNKNSYEKAEDAEDAGREFIRASLDGNYEKAKFYLLKNEDNMMLLDHWKEIYNRHPEETKIKFKQAGIRPIHIQAINDTSTLFTYSNSYTKDTTQIKIVKLKDEWVVDLKSVIEPNAN